MTDKNTGHDEYVLDANEPPLPDESESKDSENTKETPPEGDSAPEPKEEEAEETNSSDEPDDELPSEEDVETLVAETTEDTQTSSEQREKDKLTVRESTIVKWQSRALEAETQEELTALKEEAPSWVWKEVESKLTPAPVEKKEKVRPRHQIDDAVDNALRRKEFESTLREYAKQVPKEQFANFRDAVKQVVKEHPTLGRSAKDFIRACCSTRWYSSVT